MASRILYGLASRDQLPKPLAYVYPRTQTPVVATLLAGVFVTILALAGTIATLAEVTSVVILLLFALVNLSLARIELRAAPADRSWALVASSSLGMVVCLGMIAQALSNWLSG